ncbi:MAG TPA: glycosyl transferase family protein [Allosphingosinicella sp.]|jgi:adsorption protein B
MDVAEWLWSGVGAAFREGTLFAGTGFLVLGLSDLAVDLIWIALKLSRPTVPAPQPAVPARIAVFVPAWDEAAVIGAMLRGALAAFGHAAIRVYVGCYPNDPATAAAVRAVADPRIRLVTGGGPGPTTKADCLNHLWEALLADEAAGAERADAVLLHDAEDVVHPAALPLIAGLIGSFDLVQIPVLPLADPGSRWVAGVYIDEFVEAHSKELVVRQALGAGLPAAGVGCAFSRAALAAIAGRNHGHPFDSASLTEDYELGLRLAEAGGRSAFVRARDSAGSLIATREYFPATLRAAVAQKSRWMCGIALAGWDRLGWRGGLAERWMRLRDRQAPLAALLLVAGYGALALWLALEARQAATGQAPPALPHGLSLLLRANLALLAWRLALRGAFVAHAYGGAEGLRSIPRIVVANAIAMLAARAALSRYRALRRTGRPRWDKTRHVFPAETAGA